jgi:hypothetical protein
LGGRRFELCSNEPTLATIKLSRRWGTRRLAVFAPVETAFG